MTLGGIARRRRRGRATTAVLLGLGAAVLTTLSTVSPGGVADAAIGPPVPVVGVATIGWGQLGYGTYNRVVEYVRGSSATTDPQTGVIVAGAGGQGPGLNQLNAPAGLALDGRDDMTLTSS